MQKGVKVRLIVHEILKLIKIKSYDFDNALLIKIHKKNIILSDKKFIYKVVLNSLRYYFLVDQIIGALTKKIKKNSDDYFLLLSAITQIVFLNFKDFAVVNCTVELAKLNKNKYSKNFINAVLRNVVNKKKLLQKTKIKFNKLPKWFLEKTQNLNLSNRNIFIKSILEEPDLHIVFKKFKKIPRSINGVKTTNNSMVVKNFDSIVSIPDYKKGSWWVQDLGAMLPIYLTEISDNAKAIDLCAAPGGKTFQLFDKGAKITAYEKSVNRSNIMRNNLNRLKIKCDLKTKDSLKLKSNQQYDLVVLDAPCSAIGTIRRNPEIFYKKNPPNFKDILKLQYDFLKISKRMLKVKGMLIYIVCSFLEEEGEKQINKFLIENKNFSINKYSGEKFNFSKGLINKNGFISTIPKKLDNGVLIDGFFAAKLIRNA